MCDDGRHALIRTYEAGGWYLACCQCPHRIEDHPKSLKEESEK